MVDASILLFLEIKNKSINALLNAFREIFNERPSNTNIHITVRGPFKNKTKKTVMRRFVDEVKHDVLKIEGVGSFSNEDECVVYLKINSPNLEKIWFKSDYPKNTYGYNPHISLYRGRDKARAERIVKFLRGENISLLCEDYEFVFYDLSEGQKSIKEYNDESWLIEGLEVAGRIKSGILDRAKSVIVDEKY